LKLPKVTESMIRARAAPESFQRGQEYCDNDAISNTAIQGLILTGECAGTYAPYYRVRAALDEAGIAETSCTCPYDYGGDCKHVVALLLTYLHHPKQFAVRKAPAELLAGLDRGDLDAILTKLIQEQPELGDRIETLISVPAARSRQTRNKLKKEV
jgi:uncharacterized Zn finger protein